MTASRVVPEPGLASADSSQRDPIPAALAALRAGRMVVVVDDAERENEGDLTAAAGSITPDMINFMARHGRGLICVAMTGERLDQLAIPLMTAENTSNFGTAFCESVDARTGVTTGISAADRARTIRVLADPASRPEDLARPGHIFPLRARPGGVLARAGQTEAAVDLARMAGLVPAGVICEVMNEDGTMARAPELAAFCRQHDLPLIAVADVIRYRRQHEPGLRRLAETVLDTAYGPARWLLYGGAADGERHSALVFGAPTPDQPVLVRVQAHCLPGAIFASRHCDCHAALTGSLRQIAAAGQGVLVYLHQDTGGLDLTACGATAHGHPPSALEREPGSGSGPAAASGDPAHWPLQRQVGVGAQILADLGIHRLRLLTNHPRRAPALGAFGLEIIEQVPIR
ncbi:MAG: 3,4-dihydroxy-2-butanone-4-phosphate synthase [Terriglobales bacterium]